MGTTPGRRGLLRGAGEEVVEGCAAVKVAAAVRLEARMARKRKRSKDGRRTMTRS